MKINNFFDKKLLKFILVGIINTIVGSAIMFSLFNIVGFSYWVSSAGNIVFTSTLSFFLNKYFTFGVKQWSVFMIFAFILTIAASYLISYGLAKTVFEYFLRNSDPQVRGNVAMFVGMCLFTGINYLGQRFVVFRKGEEK